MTRTAAPLRTLLVLAAAVAVGPPTAGAASVQSTDCGATTQDPELRSALCTIERRAEATRSDAVLVLHRGVPVLSAGDPDEPVHVMSVTKSVVALAIGRMLLDGDLESLDVPVSELLPAWRQGRKAEITIRHLLTHTSGLQDVSNAGLEIEPAPDVVALAIAAEVESDPGSAFRYNNKAVNLLPWIVEELTGEPIDRYLERTVFADLGIGRVTWLRDPAGTPYGMAGLTIGAADLARLGRLVGNGGVWEGRPVIDSAFARAAVEPQHELHERHGLLWWLLPGEDGAPEGFYGNGWLGQWLVVFPEADVVGVRLVSRDAWREEGDNFGDFRDRVGAVARVVTR